MTWPGLVLALICSLSAVAQLSLNAELQADYRRFHGLDDPRYSEAEQTSRRKEMMDGVWRTVLSYPGLKLDDPTGGFFGAPGQSVAAAFSINPLTGNVWSDLGVLLRQKAAPRDMQKNHYAEATRDVEERLMAQVRKQPGRLQPADLLKLALDEVDGNYPLATLSVHNLLKNAAYAGRGAESRNVDNTGQFSSLPGGVGSQNGNEFVLELAGKLENLRGQPADNGMDGDKFGPWYHIFGIMFLSSVSNLPQTSFMTNAEHLTRELRLGSIPDPEKASWDKVTVDLLRDLRLYLYAGKPKPDFSPRLSAAPPASVTTGLKKGQLQVAVVDADSRASLPRAHIRAETGSAGDRRIYDWLPVNEAVPLPVGEYELSVSVDGRYSDQGFFIEGYGNPVKRRVSIKAGDTANVRIELQSDWGFVHITAHDGVSGQLLTGVNVQVFDLAGGWTVGGYSAPVTYPVRAGTMRIVGRLRGYQNSNFGPVTVRSGQRLELKIPMQKEKQPTARRLRIEPPWLMLQAGDGLELAAFLDVDGQLRPVSPTHWSSSRPEVAGTDSRGYVTAVAAGEAQIEARFDGLTATMTLQVGDGAAASSCRIQGPKTLAARGDGGRLKAVAVDSQGKPLAIESVVKWTSSDETVVHIDSASGELTTKNSGKATLMAELRVATGASALCYFDLHVDERYRDLLVSGKVVGSDGKPVAGAQVSAGEGGVVVSSDNDGSFSVLAGGGPYAEGASVSALAIFGKQRGNSEGRVLRGQVRDLRVMLGAGQAGSADKSKTFNPAHLFELQDKAGKTFYLLYARADRSQLDKNKFRFPDGGGGYYHYAGKDLGVYKDEAGVCAVLRGKNIYSVSYNLGSWSISCDKQGPVATATGNTGVESTASAGGPLPAQKPAVPAFRSVVVAGQVSYYVGKPVLAQPLSKDKPLPAGATVITGKESSAHLQSAGINIELGAETQATWHPAGSNSEALSYFEMDRGSLLIDHPPGQEPGFDGLEVWTPHSRARPTGTRYKVSTDANGSYVQVFEGQVQLTGEMLARTDEKFQLPGKSAFSKKLTLAAGQYAKAFIVRLADDAAPAWLGGKPAAAALAGGSGKPGSVPDWLAADPHVKTDAWQQTSVQNWMDQWIKEARPAVSKPGLTFRYSDWGVLLSSAAKAAGPPEHPSGWTRHQYLWERREQLDSWNLCTLGEYLRRRQSGAALSDCARTEPRPAQAAVNENSSHAPAPDTATQSDAQISAVVASAWFKIWACESYAPAQDKWSALVPFALSRTGSQLFLHYQRGRYPLEGTPQNNRYTIKFDFPGSPMYYDLELFGDRLAGSMRWKETRSKLRCVHAGPDAEVSVFGKH